MGNLVDEQHEEVQTEQPTVHQAQGLEESHKVLREMGKGSQGTNHAQTVRTRDSRNLVETHPVHTEREKLT